MSDIDNDTGVKFTMSMDFARRTKDDVKVKFTAMGNTVEEFEANYDYLKNKALRELGY